MGKIDLFFGWAARVFSGKIRPRLHTIGAFVVLLMGSGLIGIPVGSPWTVLIKFGIIAAVLGIGIWAWAKAKKNDQPPVAYLQLALFVPFAIDYHLHYAFILLTLILFNKKLLLPWKSPLKPIYLLLIWGFASYAVNQLVEFNPLSFPLFFMTFFLPFIFFGMFYRYGTEAIQAQLLRFFYALVLIMILVIGLRIFFYWGGNPDVRTGGTQGTHVAAVFLSVAFLSVLFKRDAEKKFFSRYDRREKALLVLTLPVIFLIDAKYVMIFMLLSVLIAGTADRSLAKTAKAAVWAGAVALIALWVIFTDGSLPISDAAMRDKNFNVMNISELFMDSPKAMLVKNAIALPGNDPLVFIIGSGPGTFLSRAANSRAPVDLGKRSVSYGRQIVRSNSKLPGFLPPFESRIKKKYGRDYQNLAAGLGSLHYWGSSLLNVLFETGIVGLLLFLGFFANLLIRAVAAGKARAKNGLGALITALVVFLFLMALNQLWYEQPVFQIAAYSVLGLIAKLALAPDQKTAGETAARAGTGASG